MLWQVSLIAWMTATMIWRDSRLQGIPGQAQIGAEEQGWQEAKVERTDRPPASYIALVHIRLLQFVNWQARRGRVSHPNSRLGDLPPVAILCSLGFKMLGARQCWA